MIKLEHVVLASPEQLEFIIEGMRNPMNSWEKSDSEYVTAGYDIVGFDLGEDDHSLMQRLAKAGTDHRKFMRMLPVYVRITAPLYWWKEFDTYKVGTVANSCSTMHKIQAKEFTLDDFSCEHLNRIGTSSLWDIIDVLNAARSLYLKGGDYKGEHYDPKDKQVWWQMIQLVIFTRFIDVRQNFIIHHDITCLVIATRKKLDEWRSFCKWVEELPYSELIIETAVSLEVGRMFGEPFPWTKEAGKRMGANSCSMKDVEEAIKRFDPNDGVKSHMTMIKED